jgi:hypothetical protein
VSVSNETQTTYITPKNLATASYFLKWINGDQMSTITNSYVFAVNNQTTFWAYMNLTDRYNQDWNLFLFHFLKSLTLCT